MRKVLALVFVVAFVLTGCTAVWDFITGFIPEDYDALVGTWNVIDRPPDWLDVDYIFRADRSFQINYDDNVIGYTGEVVSANPEDVTVRRITSVLEGQDARMTMCYRFLGEDTMELGWYDEATGDPVYYLTMVRESA